MSVLGEGVWGFGFVFHSSVFRVFRMIALRRCGIRLSGYSGVCGVEAQSTSVWGFCRGCFAIFGCFMVGKVLIV